MTILEFIGRIIILIVGGIIVGGGITLMLSLFLFTLMDNSSQRFFEEFEL